MTDSSIDIPATTSPSPDAPAREGVFQLVSPYQPAGDQPQAIEKLSAGFEAGLARQTLHGVTGAGQTHTGGNVPQPVERPAGGRGPNNTPGQPRHGQVQQF